MALSANDKLILVRVKIERAKKHLIDLEKGIIPYRGKRQSVGIRKTNPQTGQIASGGLIRLPVIPFDSLAAAGDVIQNLRSALDHLAYQLFTVGSPGQVPGRLLCFPICKSPEAYEEEKGRKVEGMREDAKKFIDDLKPYHGGDETLWTLHEFNNIDKHKFLLSHGPVVLCEAAWMGTSGEYPYYMLKSGDPNFAGVFGVESDDELDPTSEEAINQAAFSRVNAMLPTLLQLCEYVEALLPRFLPYLE
jgi:hypothetical protein